MYRNHFPLFAGVMAIPAALQIPTNLYAFNIWARALRMEAGHGPPFDLGALGIIYLIILPAMVVAGTLGLGAISVAVSDVYLGGVASIRGSYRKSLRRFRSLLGLLIVLFFIFAGIMTVFVIVIGLVAGAFGALGVGRGTGTAAAIVVVVAFICVVVAIVAAMVFFFMVFSLVIPALLLENASVGGALRRSITLTRGRRWHIFLGVLLMIFVSYAVVLIVQGPFLFAMFFFVAQGSSPPFWLSLGTSISAACGSAASSPLMMIAFVLYYYDQRIRKEGFDLQHMIAEIESAARPATPGIVSG